MFKNLICFLFGHKLMAKAYTGNSMSVVGLLGNEYTVSFYRWEPQKFCLRCGCKNFNLETRSNEVKSVETKSTGTIKSPRCVECGGDLSNAGMGPCPHCGSNIC
jgi:hypothetical protein